MALIGFKMKNTIRGCFRSVCNHPFLVCILCLLIFLYRSTPLIFSLLVSISPVLVSTALLLGTLLSFGHYEREIGDKTTNETVFAKTGVSKDTTVVEENMKRTEELRLDDTVPLIERKSIENELRNDSKLGDIEYKQKAEWNGDRFSDNSSYVSMTDANDKGLESEDEKSEVESLDSEMVNVDSHDSPSSPWKRMKSREDNDDDDDDDGDDEDGLDSGSDGVESSSPDESMADIMPMLDELHPLLDEEGPQTAIPSRNSSVAPSDHSQKSSTASNDSDDETKNNDELEDKGEDKKGAITWTDEDQKNVMDLGCSEIERNQRLENLMMRRRARKNMSMVPEIDLIDFESFDFPSNIAPIATRRQNPFDSPHDSYDNCPIPGSAPSILLPRRNPFDIPYDPNEEKLNLSGHGLQEELTNTTTFQSREPFFRRHESFSVGPSIFGQSRQNERQDFRFRPSFVPERVVESELSDSKLSSVAETESLGSVEDLEDDKIAEEDNVQEIESVLKNEAIEEDVEPELIANMKHVTEQIGHGSRSSSSEESLELGQIEKRDIEVNDVDIQQGIVGTVEQRHSRGSSSSSLSKVSEVVFIETENESISDGRRDSITSTLVDEVINKEPVYDSSPPSETKNSSALTSSGDVYVLPPVLVKQTVSFTETESKGKIETPSENEFVNIKDGGRTENEKKLLISKKESPNVVSVVAVTRSSDNDETVLSPNSDDDFHEANEKLTSTPSAEGSTPMFYDTGMHESSHFEHHLEEVQVPNTPVGFEEVHNFNRLNIPEIQVLDLNISPSIVSPLSPDFISIPSTVSSKVNSQIDMHTILEVGDEINDIDAELDNVRRDFNITRWGSCSIEFEKHIHSVGESSTRVVELEHLETLKPEIISNRKFNEANNPVPETISKKNEGQPVDSDINHDQGSMVEAQKVENVDVLVEQPSETDIKNPVIVEPVTGKTITENSENSMSQGSTSMVTGPAHETPILEVRTKEDNNAKRVDKETILSEGTNLSPKELLDGSTEKQLKQSSDFDSVQVEAKPNIDSGSVNFEAKSNTNVGSVKIEVKPNVDDELVKVEGNPNIDAGLGLVEVKTNTIVGTVNIEAKPNTDTESVKVEAKMNINAECDKVEAKSNTNVGSVKVEAKPSIDDESVNVKAVKLDSSVLDCTTEKLEVEAEKVALSVDEKSGLNEITEKTDQTIEMHSTTSDKGKGNIS